ncbi:uncharacterized protein PHALS_14789 [Plasmopara halstedii]|uniref:Uncharacterized protein n=1 Tax=Plasmopara halstedii TaxID=4781 RepID=A0A0N7L6T5_PLAHL|nr:uncharacterized protein PHALS_14789 [Plasmopara halstedii]CEG45171.1 hypothetical protein PHALS_14789 [Plasmopara halstedii]|eukprot:XP_024581540.1 hypothetical protein PHALS_14789 [Plasmopara halstedii]
MYHYYIAGVSAIVPNEILRTEPSKILNAMKGADSNEQNASLYVQYSTELIDSTREEPEHVIA